MPQKNGIFAIFKSHSIRQAPTKILKEPKIQFFWGIPMNPLSRHYHQPVGLYQHWVRTDVQLDVRNKTLTLLLGVVGDHVVCPECGVTCSMKDHAGERSWRHLDAMQLQTILTARVPRMDMYNMRSKDNCGSVGREAQPVHSPV